ncbi:ABC transporter transmembrane domain-containing protein [Corallincola platygyrae]|uniref:ABC transporter transmembrane domain-containing protein n=1 Tax=Corallincola platygyrae TaxID=1193278 RepID=A0ABW4XGB7_9GAMM
MRLTRTVDKDVIGKVFVPSILINLLSLAVPLTVLQIYDRILPNQSYGTATLLIAGACIAVLLEALIRFVRSWLLSAAASNTEKATFDELVTRVTSSKPDALRIVGAAGVDNGLSSISKVREWYSGGIVAGFIDLPFALLFLSLVFYIGGSLVAVPIAVWATATIIVWLVSLKSRRLGKHASQKDQERKSFMLLLGQTLQGIKRQAVESRLYSQFKRSNDARFLSKSSEEQQNAFALEFIQLASLMTSVVIVVTGALWVLNGDLTTGGLAACSILSGRAVAPLSALIGMRVKLNTIHTANHSIQQIQILPTEHELPDTGETVDTLVITKLKAHRYGRLYITSLSVNRGEILHLSSQDRHVDSFFAGILAGIDEIQSGQVEINGNPRSLSVLSALTSYAGVKGQLVSGTLLDNLCGFDPEKTDRAQQYAEKLGLSSKLAQLSEGLETKVGHTPSSPLSMGNIKLLNLATQLATPANIVVLDKPDASLDLDGLASLVKVLQEEKAQGRIIILVSHYSELINLADKSVVIEQSKQGEAA